MLDVAASAVVAAAAGVVASTARVEFAGVFHRVDDIAYVQYVVDGTVARDIHVRATAIRRDSPPVVTGNNYRYRLQ